MTSTTLTQQTSSSTPGQASDSSARPMTPEEIKAKADLELKEQERQRIMGVVPNFNTVQSGDAVPLTPGQKFHLAFKSVTDPVIFAGAAMNAGIGQAKNSNEEYGQGMEGYSKRFGAAYADTAIGTMVGNALLPVLLKEDPRYFRRGYGGFKKRFLYAASTTVITKNDNGTWGPNYSNVLGNVIAGGISNLYYPASERGVGNTFETAFIVTAEGTLGSVLFEFWPDISHRLFKTKLPPNAATANAQRTVPATSATPLP